MRLINMSACNSEDHFSTVYYWAWSVSGDQLLRPSYCLEFSVKFISFLTFDLRSLICPHICYFIVTASRDDKFGVSVEGLYWVVLCCIDRIALSGRNDYLNDYFVSAIPLRNSIIRKKMCVQRLIRTVQKQ